MNKNLFIFSGILFLNSLFSQNFISPYNLAEKHLDYMSPFQSVVGELGMVVTQNKISSDIGISILNDGGNAIDAAVAVGFSLAVTLPRAGSLGGGGFMLVYLKDKKKIINIDYKSESSANATNKTLFGFNQAPKNYDRDIVRYGYKAIAVPGTVAGLLKAHELYGTMPLSDLLKPAISLAKDGIEVSYDLEMAVNQTKQLKTDKGSIETFLNKNNKVKQGNIFTQKDLANVIELIAKNGRSGFYEGEVADKIVFAMTKNNGFINLDDLANYQPRINETISVNYNGYDVYAPGPPSVGGSVILESLNILENFEISKNNANSSVVLHLLAESLRRAHMDRASNIGDTNFYDDYINELISKKRAKELSTSIRFNKATKNSSISPYTNFEEGESTTHYSIIDKNGNAVSNTYTLGYSYGSGVTIPGTGILMNNQMSNFSYDYDGIEVSGRFANPLNRLEPKKRSITNMSPVFVFKDNNLKLITGSPGGNRIPAAILRIITGVIDFNLSISDATMLPRINMSYTPDTSLEYESILSEDTIKNLKSKGHTLVKSKSIGATQSIYIDNNIKYGYSDLRRPNSSVAVQIHNIN